MTVGTLTHRFWTASLDDSGTWMGSDPAVVGLLNRSYSPLRGHSSADGEPGRAQLAQAARDLNARAKFAAAGEGQQDRPFDGLSRYEFDPNQPRDDDGKWTDGGKGGGASKAARTRKKLADLAEVVARHKASLAELDAKAAAIRQIPPIKRTREQNKQFGELVRERDRLLIQRLPGLAEAHEALFAHAGGGVKHEVRRPGGEIGEKVATAFKFLDRLVGATGLPPVSVAVEPESDRPRYDLDAKEIRLHPGAGPRAVCHEYGHWLEDHLPGAHEAAVAFLKKRIDGGKPGRMGGTYDSNEWGVEDDFGKAFGNSARYVGKLYGGWRDGQLSPKAVATEIISMGVEKLYTDPAGLARNDPEFFDFLLGILAGELS